MINDVAVVGLGYVGFPLFETIKRNQPNDDVIGIDIDESKVKACKRKGLPVYTDYKKVSHCDIIIIAVPTPVDSTNTPDLSAVLDATENVAKNMKKGSIIVYESSLYPGCIEETLIPRIQTVSGFKAYTEFDVVYSPERVSPGDTGMKLHDMTKLIACPSRHNADKVWKIYDNAGIRTFVISDTPNAYQIAEMSKLFENIQRDVNIALMNEFSQICSKYYDFNFRDVLIAAETKENFSLFHPGLVGGHCIPVDPHYMQYCLKRIGTVSKMIQTARSINEEYIESIADAIMEKIDNDTKKIAVIGLSYKPNVADTRNSGAYRILNILKDTYKNIEYVAFDPYVFDSEHQNSFEDCQDADIVILATPHSVFFTNEYDFASGWNYERIIMFDLASALLYRPEFKGVNFKEYINF